MALWPTSPSAIRSRISSYRRILRSEAAASGGFGDGYGKRYWLFHLYFLLGEEDDARAYIDWYRATFPDDCGHVGQLLCWALLLRRFGREDEALYRFVRAIDENLPAVAEVAGDYKGPYGMWGEEVAEFNDLLPDITHAMTAEERRWLKSLWWLPEVTAMRHRFVAIGRALVDAHQREERVPLLDEQRALVQAFKPKEMPPLSAEGAGSWLTAGGGGVQV